MVEGILWSVARLRERARECFRLGAKDAARQMEACARDLERDAAEERTDPSCIAVCVNCGHPTPCHHVPPRG